MVSKGGKISSGSKASTGSKVSVGSKGSVVKANMDLVLNKISYWELQLEAMNRKQLRKKAKAEGKKCIKCGQLIFVKT